jgi:hypothetical protein
VYCVRSLRPSYSAEAQRAVLVQNRRSEHLVSYREHTHDDFGWQPPVNLGPGVNSAFDESMGVYVENNDTGAPAALLASNRPGGFGGFDIYVSELLVDATFGPATLVPELNSTVADPGLMWSDLTASKPSSTRPDPASAQQTCRRRRAKQCSISGRRR